MISFSVPDNLADLGMINVVYDVGGFIFDYLVTEKRSLLPNEYCKIKL